MIHEATDVDYATLGKGDVLSVGHCEAMLGLSPSLHPKAYQFALMGLIDQVRRDLMQVGKRYTVAQRKGQVVQDVGLGQIVGTADGKQLGELQNPADARLFVESHEVFTETGLTPRELGEVYKAAKGSGSL